MQWKELGTITILIVDDDPFNRLLIKSLLENFSQIHFLEASDGLEALEIVQTEIVDMIFLALHLPKMNGHQTLIELRKQKVSKHISILAMTTNEKEKEHFYSEGIDDCISKPFKLEELEKQIYQNIIKKKRDIKKNDKQELSSQKDIESYSKAQIQVSQQDFFLKIVSLKTRTDPKKRLKAKAIALIAKEFSLKLGYDKAMSHHIYYASLIRDIGVMTLTLANDEESIFSEEDKQTFQEYISLGYEMLSGAIETDFLKVAKIVISQYKEAYDGSGTPQGLQKDEIHDVAVIVAIAETFEALLSDKIYRIPRQYSSKEAYLILLKSQMRFKPTLLKVFLKHFVEFVTLRTSIINI
jgi:putative two-component system response regulator